MSVVMASCNPDYDLLKSSVLSVLCQTYRDFELIIVDDGSKIPIEPIIKSISSDERIRVYRINNSGLGAALNYGIRKSKGCYIARLDDDDLMSIDRLQIQKDYLDNHLGVSCVGSHRYSYCNGKFLKHHKFPIEHDEIIKSLLSLKFSMAHSALMFRRESFDRIGGYRISGVGQDLDLLLQMGIVGHLANVDAYLVYYYLSLGSLSAVNPYKRLNAYLYALRSVVDNKQYVQFTELTLQSISKINDTLKSNRKKRNLKKIVTVMLVAIFGNRIPDKL